MEQLGWFLFIWTWIAATMLIVVHAHDTQKNPNMPWFVALMLVFIIPILYVVGVIVGTVKNVGR